METLHRCLSTAFLLFYQTEQNRLAGVVSRKKLYWSCKC